ncbi:Phosphoenolpyruvate/pyruvate domain-containing protein [Stereum hirsutum FP-91666 SS1]|uniref:Phosphoenolpyruvate/pyruvate domain-containing protein n=1 Tax=Stereum hirsutum (strain FP-91666) TaxID=721885 RepID=UPI0004449ADF|nr:Phosphoenolpyruvate/pyruvate domain-containing protein [Stereum hirsutum FP-91666 SS1]EIM80822.1 Phosphoenolpyruvate/pyruvate domain-containing protein [Stereum hirsutum FP-91666 SS1]
MATEGATRLRQLLKDPSHLVVCPGVYDGLTARVALSMGFEALYMTGAGTSISRLGMADLGIATFNDMHENAAMLAGLDRSVPLIADADTGYGGPIMASRTAEAYARAGVAALHIEDQAQEKRCGHLGGKLIVPTEVYCSRIRAAVQARTRICSDMLIIARTDARQSLGFEEACKRLEAAVDAGADAVFLEGILSKEEGRKVCEIMGEKKGTEAWGEAGVPCLMNLVPGGVSPDMTVEEARELGFRIMIFPTIGIEGAIKGVKESMGLLKSDGRQKLEEGQGVREAFKLAGLDHLMKIDDEAGGVNLKSA